MYIKCHNFRELSYVRMHISSHFLLALAPNLRNTTAKVHLYLCMLKTLCMNMFHIITTPSLHFCGETKSLKKDVGLWVTCYRPCLVLMFFITVYTIPLYSILVILWTQALLLLLQLQWKQQAKVTKGARFHHVKTLL